jgi:hypothetical protein
MLSIFKMVSILLSSHYCQGKAQWKKRNEETEDKLEKSKAEFIRPWVN